MARLARDYFVNLQQVDIRPQPQSDQENIIRQVLPNNPPRISPENLTILSSYITQEEVETSIHSLPTHSAAGLDGIPYELWKALLKMANAARKLEQPFFDIGKLLTVIYNSIESDGLCADSKFSEGWVCPLHKKG